MAKVRTITETLEIIHPQLPELKVTARILEPVEAMDLFSQFQRYQKTYVVLDPNTDEPYRDPETGELVTTTVTRLPPKAIIDILDNVLENLEGLEDENSKPIPLERKSLKYLFSRALNCKFEKEVKTKDKDTGDEITEIVEQELSFPDYIQMKLNEVSLPSSEDKKSPKAKTSTKRR